MTMFSSNVQPRKFGFGQLQSDWTCVCGQHNERYLLLCRLCGIPRNFGDIPKEKEKG